MDDAQQKACQFWLLTLWLLTFWLFTAPSPSIECQKVSSALEIVSKSIFCTLFRVIYQLSVLFEVLYVRAGRAHGPRDGCPRSSRVRDVPIRFPLL